MANDKYAYILVNRDLSEDHPDYIIAAVQFNDENYNRIATYMCQLKGISCEIKQVYKNREIIRTIHMKRLSWDPVKRKYLLARDIAERTRMLTYLNKHINAVVKLAAVYKGPKDDIVLQLYDIQIALEKEINSYDKQKKLY